MEYQKASQVSFEDNKYATDEGSQLNGSNDEGENTQKQYKPPSPPKPGE